MTGDIEPAQKHFPAVLEMETPEDLRLAEAEVLTERSGESAMVLLDDCLSELDPGRQERLLSSLSAYRQVFLTTAVPVGGLPGALWRVEAGRIENTSSC